MTDYNKCCWVCGLEKEKNELSSILKVKINICSECDKLPQEQITAGVMANKVISHRMKQNVFNALKKNPLGRAYIEKVKKRAKNKGVIKE